NLRLPGQYFDHETTFHYNGFRDYIPAIGRYIESDPIGLGGGLNTYAYVEGMPLNFVDPLGLSSWNLYKHGSPEAIQADQYNPPGVYSITAHGLPWGILDENQPGPFGGAVLDEARILQYLADPQNGYIPGTPL